MKIPRHAPRLKKIAELASSDDCVLVYQDEVHFQQQTTITRAWNKKGSKPTIKSFPGRSKVSYSGFVIPETGELFTTKPDRFNYLTFIDSVTAFIDANPIEEGKRYVIVLDNAPWHKKAVRLIQEDCLEEYQHVRDSVEFLKLPPYSPDLNPIEQVWRITRRENTHNTFFDSVSIMEHTVDTALAAWAEPNDQLRSLCSFKS
ncbi:MAG: IS630 family transposase [Eubacteriaceae bacterium]|nr:IS630 family transposase [Eubacteriaceae bacterium]